MAKNGVIRTRQQQNAAQAAEKTQLTMRDYVKKMNVAIKEALPAVITPDRFTRMVFTALSTTPKLNECVPDSFVGAMMTAAQLGVEPNTALGQAYIIPYWNGRKQVYEAQFQLGYKGLIDLAYRSGEVSIIQAHEVYANDTFEYELGIDPKLKHIPAATDRGNVIAYYAMFKTKDGGYGFEVMSRQDVEKHAQKFSKSYDNGPWKTNFDEMAKKTVLKKVLKYAPLKSDFAREVAQDSTIKYGIDKDMSAVPDATIEGDYEIIGDDNDGNVDPSTGEVLSGANVDAYGDAYGDELLGGD